MNPKMPIHVAELLALALGALMPSRECPLSLPLLLLSLKASLHAGDNPSPRRPLSLEIPDP